MAKKLIALQTSGPFEYVHVPPNLLLEAGQMLSMRAPDGNIFPVVISEVREDSCSLDFNHPLAGKELQFEVTVLDIQ